MSPCTRIGEEDPEKFGDVRSAVDWTSQFARTTVLRCGDQREQAGLAPLEAAESLLIGAEDGAVFPERLPGRVRPEALVGSRRWTRRGCAASRDTSSSHHARTAVTRRKKRMRQRCRQRRKKGLPCLIACRTQMKSFAMCSARGEGDQKLPSSRGQQWLPAFNVSKRNDIGLGPMAAVNGEERQVEA